MNWSHFLSWFELLIFFLSLKQRVGGVFQFLHDNNSYWTVLAHITFDDLGVNPRPWGCQKCNSAHCIFSSSSYSVKLTVCMAVECTEKATNGVFFSWVMCALKEDKWCINGFGENFHCMLFLLGLSSNYVWLLSWNRYDCDLGWKVEMLFTAFSAWSDCKKRQRERGHDLVHVRERVLMSFIINYIILIWCKHKTLSSTVVENAHAIGLYD